MSMDCDICSHPFSVQRRPLCASCASATTYTARIDQAKALLDREKAHNHVEAVLRPGNDGVLAALSEDTDLDAITTETRTLRLVQFQREQEQTRRRIEGIATKATDLRAEIEQYKKYRAQRQEEATARRRALETARQQLKTERTRASEPVVAAIKKSVQRLDKVSTRTAEARAFLCNQVAMLLGLKKLKREDRGSSEYWLAGIPMLTLRHLCRLTTDGSRRDSQPTSGLADWAAPHELITASLEHMSRLLVLCCHYLSVRLPAELTLPSCDTVRPQIIPEKAAYKPKEKSLTAVAASLATSSIQRSSTDRESTGTRSRVLYLDRPLQQLSREDPKGFQLFVESAMLLAWNVAWLCKTQGIDSVNSFEDVCAIGRNLYLLLGSNALHSRRRPPISRAGTADMSEGQTHVMPESKLSLGTFSHASARHALHAIGGQALLSDWRFASSTASTRLVDKLANHLVSEMSRQEWDIVDENEWDEEREDERPVLVGGARRPAAGTNGPTMSVMTVTDPRAQTERSGKGQNGWMKVRERVDL